MRAQEYAGTRQELTSMEETPEEIHLRQTGEWWADPWWLEDNWAEIRPIPKDQVQEAFEYLKTIFDPSWVRSYKGNLVENLFLRSVLYDRSVFTRKHLVSLAERLRRLEGAKGIQTVIRNLRGRQESDAADMELQLADYFAEEGYQIEFPVAKSKKGKSPDIRMTRGESTFAVECKNLRISEDAAWLSNVFYRVSSRLSSLLESKGLWYEFAFYETNVRTILLARKDKKDIESVSSELTNRIVEELEAAEVRDRWPMWLWIDNRGEGFFCKAESSTGSSIGYPELPDELIFRRMVQNALIPAAKQLRAVQAPGLVAIHARDIPITEFLAGEIKRLFLDNQESFSHILAVLVLPWQGWFHKNKPILITNRHGKCDWDGSGMDLVLAKFDPIHL